jgi:hypothetical protein
VSLAAYDIDNGPDDADPRDPGGQAADPAGRRDRALPGPAMTTSGTVEKPAELAVSARERVQRPRPLDGILRIFTTMSTFARYACRASRAPTTATRASAGGSRILSAAATRTASTSQPSQSQPTGVSSQPAPCPSPAANAPFTSVHRFENGPIIEAHQYFSDQALLQRLGLFP